MLSSTTTATIICRRRRRHFLCATTKQYNTTSKKNNNNNNNYSSSSCIPSTIQRTIRSCSYPSSSFRIDCMRTKQQQQQQQQLSSRTSSFILQSSLNNKKSSLLLISRITSTYLLFFHHFTTKSTKTTISSSSSVRAYSSSYWGGNNNNKMSSYTTVRSSDGTIIVAPKKEAIQSALVVISHGLGDTAEGWVDVAENLIEKMPYCKFILPTAPTQPVTMNMGMSMPSWYDITGLDERSNENCKGIENSMETLKNILVTEHTTTQLPYSRMILAGFSQGGALSLYTGLQLPSVEQKLGGIILMSGYLPALSKFHVTPGLEDTPIFHGHGTQDPLVQLSMAQKSVIKLQEMGISKYTMKTYPIDHTVSMNELDDVYNFLQACLPDKIECRIQLQDPSTMSVKQLREAIKKAGLSHKAVGLMEKHEFVRLLKAHRDGGEL